MKLRQLLFVLLVFGTLSNLHAQAIGRTGKIVPTISLQQATDILNNTSKISIPTGGTEGQVLTIVGGIPLWTDPIKLVTFYRDTDGDGYGNNDEQLIVLSGTGAPNGYIGNYTDCDDNDATINPDTVWYTGVDTDGDTFFGSTTSLIQCESPGAVYVRIAPTTPDCDDIALGGAIFNPNTVWYIGVDADNDTYIGSVTQVIQCESPGVDYDLIAPTIEDCNDGDASISPTAVWYADIDGDGFGDINTSETGCTPTLVNATQDNTDCNDTDSSANDTDRLWYLDFDNDGYATSMVTLCNSPGTGYTNTAMPLGDCNDADNTINPGALEISGDGIDNNCDAQIDEAQIGQFRGAGIVFWVDPADNYIGLVCAIEDQNSGSKIRWSNGSTINTGATETAIGSGLANTDAIILAQGATETSCAAGIARAYTGGGFNDWFLPSKDELNQMVVHRAIINSTANSNGGANFPTHVWSSTQHNYSYGYAWIMNFIGGYHNLKNIESEPNFVRAVRVFDCNDNDAHRIWYLDADGDNYAVSKTTQCASPGVGYTQTALSLGDCNDNDATINPDTVWYLDADGDNYAISNTIQCSSPGEGYITNVLPLGDCNDNDAEINPNTVWYLDADGDNYAVSTITQCDPGEGYTQTALLLGDCNDSDATINPDTVWYLDADGDNYAVSTTTQCDPGEGYTQTALLLGDCNDSDATINPATVWYLDTDGDNYAISNTIQCTSPGEGYTQTALLLGDCNDSDATINPDTVWYLDADGDNYAISNTIQCTSPGEGYTQTALLLGDCNDNDATINPDTVWYLDADGDNYAISNTIQCTSPGEGYTQTALLLGDCNDNDATINPATVWYLDGDGDNYAISTKTQCSNPGAGYTNTVLPLSDCNDTDGSINSGNIEDLENGIDDDCDGKIDEVDIGDLIQGGIVFWLDPENNMRGKVCYYKDATDAKIWNNAKTYCNELGVTRNTVLYDDWYLPSIDDLKLMYDNKTTINTTALANLGGSFEDYTYWSSSEFDNLGASIQSFTNGNQSHNVNKGDTGRVRAVRAFCNAQTEVPYDGIDNDCNLATLDDDLDGDGFVNANDCNDSDAAINPTTVWYLDADGDNYAISTKTQCANPGAGYTATVLPLSDCNDSDATINPATVWYLDADGDNYAISTKTQCINPGVGYTATVLPLSDCNDSDGSINPGVTEVRYDDIDNDCNAATLDDEAKVGDSRDGGIVFWVDPTNKAKGKVCWLLNGNNANWNDAMAYCNGLEVTRDNVFYDDWYLPSIWELNLIWWNLYKSDKRNFKDHWYWSSTDNGDNYRAWEQDFSSLSSQRTADYKVLKSSKAYSRAVRAF
jgi:hypothetical protein